MSPVQCVTDVPVHSPLSVLSTSLLRAVRTPTFRAGVAGRDTGPLWWVAEDAKRLETGEEWNSPLEKHPEVKEGTQMYGESHSSAGNVRHREDGSRTLRRASSVETDSDGASRSSLPLHQQSPSTFLFARHCLRFLKQRFFL
jgi:hypothetical protein